MENTARRALIDVLFIWVFASFWKSTIRWIVLLIVTVGISSVVRNAASDLKTHGVGQSVVLSQVGLRTSVDGHTLNWSITNNTGMTISKVVISCEDGEYNDYVAPSQYIPAGETLTGSQTDSDFSHASICKLTEALGYNK